MWLIDEIAEQHIRQAIERGELDDLPGAGKPIAMDDDRMVPKELRAGYRLLKNSGHLPPEVESLREIRDLQALLTRVQDPQERDGGIRRLRLLEARLTEGRGRGLSSGVQRKYRKQLLASLTRTEDEERRFWEQTTEARIGEIDGVGPVVSLSGKSASLYPNRTSCRRRPPQ